jgi:hypothetical protein
MGKQSSHILPYHTIIGLNTYGNPAALNTKEIVQTIYYILMYKSLPHPVQAERLNTQNRGETGFYKTSSIKHDVKA